MMTHPKKRNLPAMDSDGCNTRLLDPLNEADRVLQLKPHHIIKFLRAAAQMKENVTLLSFLTEGRIRILHVTGMDTPGTSFLRICRLELLSQNTR